VQAEHQDRSKSSSGCKCGSVIAESGGMVMRLVCGESAQRVGHLGADRVGKCVECLEHLT